LGGGVEKGKGRRRGKNNERDGDKVIFTHETPHPTPPFLERKEPRLVGLRTKTRVWR